ncbi:MAG: hypothetical protein ABS79_03545 [Planctomycetes bacterium SCN 63-9]|nr:MAG: hypothetical protein ABS79_03545 [Planctomycetes bacterium SCN 63-9]
MNFKQDFTSTITIADQPTDSDLGQLSREGFKGVINLRNDGEPEQPLSTSQEGEKATALGMDYLHYGVGGPPLTEEGVNSVCDFIDDHTAEGGKVLVHCRKGSRAKALVYLQQARKNGWGSSDVRTRSAEIGLPIEGNLLLMVEDYLRRQEQKA